MHRLIAIDNQFKAKLLDVVIFSVVLLECQQYNNYIAYPRAEQLIDLIENRDY